MNELVSVSFDKRETLCILMLYQIELMITFGTIAFQFIYMIFFLPNDYNVEIRKWFEFPYNSKFTLTSKKAWKKHCGYKEG